MQKRDHKMLAELLADEMGQSVPHLYKRAFIMGSIEPDINPFTYLHGFTKGEKFHGHNYKNILSVMEKLFDSVQKEKYLGVREYYHLGKLIHYVADAFTFPHNKEFCGDLKEHCRYERALHVQFDDILQRQKVIGVSRKGIDSFRHIEILHKEYLKKAGTYDVDCRYILQASIMLLRDQEQTVWYKAFQVVDSGQSFSSCSYGTDSGCVGYRYCGRDHVAVDRGDRREYVISTSRS